MPSNFKDYYKILQVHFDASPDVIKAAYRKLSALYHPDASGNENAAKHMLEINEAYDTLGNAEKRNAYHRIWMEQNHQRSTYVYTAAYPPHGSLYNEARTTLEQFFHALYTKKWKLAYHYLTLEDQNRISESQFCNWREAVSECYELQHYRIQEYRSYTRCRIGEFVYGQVIEYAVSVDDLDLQTSQTSQSVTHKYVAYDGTSWKVCLGMKSVKEATLKFKLMAQRRKNYDPVSLYQSAVSKKDPLTGLYSKTGFYEEAAKEVERFRRHNNPISLVAFQIRCKERSREIPCLCQCASIIKSSSRITDITARFGNNQIVCLLAETTQQQAVLAAQKFVDNIRRRQTEPFSLNAGIIQYTGKCLLEDSVFAACSDASKQGNSIWINSAEL